MEQTKRKAAIYSRVGGWEDVALLNIESTSRIETFYAESIGFQVVKQYGDYGPKNNGFKEYQGFNQLMEDARKGEFDVVVTRSIGRFGKNTIQAIRYIEKLKQLGIEVYFEKENIHSFGEVGASILDIMLKWAREEEKSIKEAKVRWAK